MRITDRRWMSAMLALAMAAMLAGCGQKQSADSSGAQETGAPSTEATPAVEWPIALSVTKDGFEPKEVRVKAGQPVTLAVTRKTDRTCATELVLKEYGINQKLPLNETVQITFTPDKSGPLTYACAMDMIKGTIVVE